MKETKEEMLRVKRYADAIEIQLISKSVPCELTSVVFPSGDSASDEVFIDISSFIKMVAKAYARSVVPEEKDIKVPKLDDVSKFTAAEMAVMAHKGSKNMGFNACREEMLKNIE